MVRVGRIGIRADVIPVALAVAVVAVIAAVLAGEGEMIQVQVVEMDHANQERTVPIVAMTVDHAVLRDYP